MGLVAVLYTTTGCNAHKEEKEEEVRFLVTSAIKLDTSITNQYVCQVQSERADFDEDDETSNDDDDRAGLNTQFAATGYHAARDYCCPLKAMATPTPEYFAYTSSFRCALYQVYRI